VLSIATKQKQVLQQIAPRITHVAPMYNPGYSSGLLQFLAELEATDVGVGLGASQLAEFEGRSGRGST
jgi:hypothetical protein